jgi:hypothetical protein
VRKRVSAEIWQGKVTPMVCELFIDDLRTYVLINGFLKITLSDINVCLHMNNMTGNGHRLLKVVC